MASQIGNGAGSNVRSSSTPSTPKTKSQDRLGSDSASTHTVQKDETLSGIAAERGIPLSQLKAANPHLERGRDFNLIRPGDKVFLPNAEATAGASATAPSTGGDVLEAGGNTAKHQAVLGQDKRDLPSETPAPNKDLPTLKAGALAMGARAQSAKKTATAKPTETAPQTPPQDKGIAYQVGGFAGGVVAGGVETAKGLWSMAKGAASLTGLRGSEKQGEAWDSLKNIGKALTTKEGLKAVAKGIAEPYTEAYKRGDYGEMAGRATFEAVSMVFGSKGLDKIGKAVRAGKAATRAASVADDVARVASKADDVARIASKADDVAKVAGKLDDVAKVAGKADDVAKVAGKADDVAKVATKADDVAKVAGQGDDVAKAAKLLDDPRELLGSSGRFKPENPEELARVQELLKKGTADADSLRGASGRFKPENAAEAQRVRELEAVLSHQKAGGSMSVGGSAASKTDDAAKVAQVLDDPRELLGASGRFKPENPEELARVQELLKKGTADADSLRGASGRFKPENAAEAQRVRELEAVLSHQKAGGSMSVGGKVTSKALGSGDEALDLLGAFGKFKPENADELAKVQSLLKKGTSDAPGLRGAFGTFKPENAAELQRVRELRAVGLHQVMADPKAFDLTSDLAALNQATRNGSRSLSSSQLKSFASPTEKALQLVDAAETSRRMGLGMSGFDAGALEQASSFLRQVGFGHRADDAAALVRLGFGG